MRNLSLVGTMLRYRVASLLLPFFLLAPALHGRLAEFRWTYVLGVVALCASYVVATCLNDVFDLDVDRVNHPDAKDRPLVTGAATPRQLLVLAAVLAAVALAAGATVGPVAVAVIAVSLALNVAYSVPPVRLCSRPMAAPVVLGLAYVALPYLLGLAASGGVPDAYDVRVLACFVVLFTGRMLLKDFRDRRGDAAFGKRTFLLTFGKDATLAAVLACVVAGDALLVTVLPVHPLLIAATESYFVAIVVQLYRLRRAPDTDTERFAIALGARMGNAVVLTLLGFVLLAGAGARAVEEGAFVIVLAAMFWFAFLYVSSRPQAALAAYRG
jgi:4-hydroxybenzoate polyprenyltransferase